MELRHIRYFIAVAEELNITRAAERLCIAQPPLSRQLKDLEAELGAPLFVRKSHGLELTEAGQLFLQYARHMVQLEEQSREDIGKLDHGLSGMLHLDSIDGQGPHFLALWLSGFHKKHPNVKFTLWKGNSDEVQHRLSKGLSDMGVIMKPYNELGFDAVPVYREPWVALMPADHPLAKRPGNSVSCRELSEYELIIPARANRNLEIERWFHRAGCEPKVIGSVAHIMNAYELAAEHVGISIYPAAAMRLARPDEVCAKVISDSTAYADYLLVRSSEREPSVAAREFWNYVVENYPYAESGLF